MGINWSKAVQISLGNGYLSELKNGGITAQAQIGCDKTERDGLATCQHLAHLKKYFCQ